MNKHSSQLYHHSLSKSAEDSLEYCWCEDGITFFKEVLFSWNSRALKRGELTIQISLKGKQWSPWYDYAVWGGDRQSGSRLKDDETGIVIDDDIVSSKTPCTGFKVRVISNRVNVGRLLHSLHACTSDPSEANIQKDPLKKSFSSIHLPVPAISQMLLPHQRHRDLCSPTSMTSVVNFLGNLEVDPVVFSESVKDQKYDIFGNWVLNVAEASSYLGEKWRCWVERMSGFDKLHECLKKGVPVVVSFRGPIKGGAFPYESGHLVVVNGYDEKDQSVLCMDPAFPSQDETCVRYPLEDFLQAWGRRRNLAYVFDP